MLKKLLSYLFPIKVSEHPSEVSGTLQVNLQNGRLVLDTQHANYSYGSVAHIFRYGLRQIGAKNIQQMQRILVLGVAGGNVIKLLRNYFHYQGTIDGVELDPEVINLAKTHFGLDNIPNLHLHIADAQDFVKHPHTPYQLIIIDIFQDHIMPDFLFSEFFITNVMQCLAPQGRVLMNTLKLTETDAQRNQQFITFLQTKYTVKTFSNIEGSNELILISNSLKN